MLAALAAVGACSTTTGQTPYPGQCAPVDIVGWSPTPRDTGVPTNTVVTVRFSDFPDPETTSLQTMLLTSSVFRVPEAYRVDLITRSVVMAPISQLSTDLGYSVTVLAGVRSLAGCPAGTGHIEFTTGSGPVGGPPPPPPTFADISPIFAARCADNCHAAPDGSCLDAPVAGLSLCASEARNALFAAPSRQVATMALVTPLDAARSYLMRKLIPAPPDGGPMTGVMGQREPPGEPLTPEQLRAISDWIDGGALP